MNNNRIRRKPTKRRPHPNSKKAVKRKLNKKKVAITIAIFVLIIILIVKATSKKEDIVETSSNDNTSPVSVEQHEQPKEKREITEWNLRLANYENILPEDFEVEVVDIDKTRQFDARAIKYLNQMMNDMKKDGITNVWVQSAYRSIERQKELYDNRSGRAHV